MITGRLAAPSAGAPFSDAAIAEGGLAFLAGQGPVLNGTVAGGSIGEQTRVTNRMRRRARQASIVSGAATCARRWSSRVEHVRCRDQHADQVDHVPARREPERGRFDPVAD
jgi:hypothetical protein